MLQAFDNRTPEAAPVPPQPTVASRDGATARLVDDGGEERLELRDPRGQLLFSYCSETGKGILTIPAGDLELRAPTGHIDLVAGGDVRLHAGGSVDLGGNREVRLAAGPATAPADSELTLGRRELAVRSPKVDLAAGHGTFLIGETIFRGLRATTAVHHLKLFAGKLETTAGRILEKAKDVYRRVESLHQLEAGRARTLVRGSYYLLGKRTYLHGEKAVKVDAERIELG